MARKWLSHGLGNERTHDRWSAVNAATNAIYLALGAERDRELQSAFEQLASTRTSATGTNLR
jgi:hypothetical protein